MILCPLIKCKDSVFIFISDFSEDSDSDSSSFYEDDWFFFIGVYFLIFLDYIGELVLLRLLFFSLKF